MESARIVAGVARVVRDVGLAEDLAHDALIAAMDQWPRDGVPDNPGAWLAATARRRAIDTIRREQNLARKTEQLVDEGHVATVAPSADAGVGDGTREIGDELLALLFATCHPVLPRESRVALTLRLFGGLTTDEVARALLVESPTVGQRISRAKKKLAAEGPAALEVPVGDELDAAPRARCSRSSTWCSTRATRPAPATTGPARPCARRRCGWAACWRGCCPARPRSTAWSR